ncbi:unnamed protein product [Ranitomeya imitator]|uniref:Dynein regulatory complex subunit 2 n=1 Tax=Ranitomeya imitator TaxID=111125 RepID=A0ABN9KTQ7_9NEOB|nr:unnamed protein product [Ranitomeya imitator]
MRRRSWREECARWEPGTGNEAGGEETGMRTHAAVYIITMPKKGGKKSGKLSRMTEEERLLYMQQKMMAEEEQNKKKEDMLMQFLKDKLAKEEQSSKINMSKLNVQWRAVLREAKAKELCKDIEILHQTFERVVDCKDNVIKSLIKDVDEAEEQYAHALRSHLQNIDQLLELQRERLDLLQEEYQQEMEAIRREFDTERKMIIELNEKEMSYLENMMLAMEQNTLESENEAKQEFQSMRDDIKNKNLEEKHSLRVILEGTVEDLWKQFQQALKNYTNATEDRKIAFETLKAKDEKSSEEIAYQMKKLQKIQVRVVSHLRFCLQRFLHKKTHAFFFPIFNIENACVFCCTRLVAF